jgi:hypothetical protein
MGPIEETCESMRVIDDDASVRIRDVEQEVDDEAPMNARILSVASG